MNIVLSIPSGQRTETLIDVIYKWRKVCDFKIAIYAWDEKTEKDVSGLADYLWRGELASFAVNQNFVARNVEAWDVFICGADDLYPGCNIGKIESVCRQCSDKILWVRDGFLDAQPTHAIITRGWYEKYGCIFDEKFKHNFCDSDLFMRAMQANEIVKCFDIAFDHRHYLRTNHKKDDIYKLGEKSYGEDDRYFKSKYTKEQLSVNINDIPEIRA